MNSKSILKSKTFWLNAIAVLSMFIPQVAAWLRANPETAAAALASINILLRFVTAGRISIFADSGKDSITETGMTPCWLVGLTMAGLICTALPSCSSSQVDAMKNIPIRAALVTDYGTAAYSSKSGISLVVDRRSGK